MPDDSLVRAIEDFKTANLNPQAASVDVCGVYNKVKPILSGILPFLKLIPVVGATVAEAVTLLMSVLDKICPTPAAAMSPARA